MCGIFFLTQKAKEHDEKTVRTMKQAFQSGGGRGPDNNVFIQNFHADIETLEHYTVSSPWIFQHYFNVGFHRLSINGLDDGSNQPLVVDNVAVICNGEIYNYKELYAEHNITPQTNSDCEVIIHLYLKYGEKKMLELIHGVFAFVLIDDRNLRKDQYVSSNAVHYLSAIKNEINTEEYSNNKTTNTYLNMSESFFYDRKVVIARDSYGIRPMFMMKRKNGTFGVASLLKQLQPLCNEDETILQFKPGTANTYYYHKGHIVEKNNYDFKYALLKNKMIPLNQDDTIATSFNVNKLLTEAVKMRVDNTDRPVACLLSGGLDSSLITALVAKCVPDPSKLNTFSIGMAGGSDLLYAKMVAQHLGTNHHEIIVSEDDFFAAIPKVIETIESYDTTTVRASVGNYLIGKYIKENCDAKVIFNGDGSDELFGGYLYMHCAPDSEAFHEETKRLLNNIHFFDVLRSDRCISTHGLEPRTPFMDLNLIAYYLSVDKNVRNHSACNPQLMKNGKIPEKYILRNAFSQQKLLPDKVLWRTKEAFSDGVSNEKNSWHNIIKNRLSAGEKDIRNAPNYNPDLTLEQNYYRQVFDSKYPNRKDVIPYYWMPNFVDAQDCSARSLGIYNDLQ